MEIYAPLADRMGMHRIRDELEDLSFEVLNVEARSLIQKRLDEIKLDKKDIFETLSIEINTFLKKIILILKFMGEKKLLFLFGEKFKKRVSLEQITDIIGFRIILKNIDDCYKTLGILHKQWNCVPGKFKRLYIFTKN